MILSVNGRHLVCIILLAHIDREGKNEYAINDNDYYFQITNKQTENLRRCNKLAMKQKSEEMRQYVWINPVVEAMAGADYPALLLVLASKGFTVVSCSTGVDKVREGYRECLHTCAKPLIDTRCPLIKQLIFHHYPHMRERLAGVPPILISCAAELYETYVACSPYPARLTVITPCVALAEEGKTRFGDRICFMTWIQFNQEQTLRCHLRRISASPIPPGFFHYDNCRVAEASGKEQVKQVLDRMVQTPNEADLLELLYCQGGCHNGDGV